MDDQQKELERLQKALLAEEDDRDPDTVTGRRPKPAFDDPEEIRDPQRRGYRNYANNYGRTDPPPKAEEKTGSNDKLVLGLMVAASALCLGIIAVLIYWLGVLS
ncbi:MAG: hypothetical protein E7436_06090 [Ruminococcaceae bacterium]|nr:hypothetical protein [Oscillospiraceae bacterium]